MRGIVEPVLTSRSPLLDCDERLLTLFEADDIFCVASSSSKSMLEEDFERLKLDA